MTRVMLVLKVLKAQMEKRVPMETKDLLDQMAHKVKRERLELENQVRKVYFTIPISF